MKERIAIFGGSFNPIHLGHINLAVELYEKLGLDQVWFIPAYLSPHKLGLDIASATHRLNMLSLALEPYPNFIVRDDEIKRGGPSYSIDTIRSLHSAYPGKDFFLVLGSDLIKDFHRWRCVKEIFEEVKVVVGDRLDSISGDDYYSLKLKKCHTKTSVMEVSSTQLRQRIALGKICNHLLPNKVLDYIHKNHLYCQD